MEKVILAGISVGIMSILGASLISFGITTNENVKNLKEELNQAARISNFEERLKKRRKQEKIREEAFRDLPVVEVSENRSLNKFERKKQVEKDMMSSSKIMRKRKNMRKFPDGFAVPLVAKRWEASYKQYKRAKNDENYKIKIENRGCYALKKYNCTSKHMQKIGIDNRNCEFNRDNQSKCTPKRSFS